MNYKNTLTFNDCQYDLFSNEIQMKRKFPSTRYQGSKLKLTDWIWKSIKSLNFTTVLEAFGGTGCVSYKLKEQNKTVTYNDILQFNYFIGKALVENEHTTLDNNDLDYILNRHSHIKYSSFIQDTFKDIYFTDEENQWLDVVTTNIISIPNIYKKALAFFCLFQSCIAKRPYNLFHRKNLYVRLADVTRSFGNKKTWDTSFTDHFSKNVTEVNQAIFANGKRNVALNKDVFDLNNNYDLVYIDTPYISNKGVGVDYLDFYHFLEGLTIYSTWGDAIDYKSKHKKMKKKQSVWTDKKRINQAFNQLFHKFKDSILIVSYRSDGIPSIDELHQLLSRYKSSIDILTNGDYKYVLSTNNKSQEILLIGN